MPVEIERKFLLSGKPPVELGEGLTLRQGYLCDDPARTVRIRIQGETAVLTVKGAPESDGLTRFEWEKSIEVEEAVELLDRCLPGVVEKIRYRLSYGSKIWEIDRYTGALEGLWVAEVELTSSQEQVALPGWLGQEVSVDGRYTNAALRRIIADGGDWQKLLDP